MNVIEGVFNKGIGLVIDCEVKVVHEVAIFFSIVLDDGLELFCGSGLLFGEGLFN